VLLGAQFCDLVFKGVMWKRSNGGDELDTPIIKLISQ